MKLIISLNQTNYMKRFLLKTKSIPMRNIGALVFGIGIIIAVLVMTNPQQSIAGPTNNVSGWAWSDMPNGNGIIPIEDPLIGQVQDPAPYIGSNEITDITNSYGGRGLGWISLNSSNPGSGGGSYGVNLDIQTGIFSGYGWSEYGGWVDFAPTTGFPESPNTGAKVDPVCLASENPCPITGWIRYIDAAKDAQSGGWDGWVKMSGRTKPESPRDLSTKEYGVGLLAPVDNIRNFNNGYAWGGDVVGWVNFSKAQINIGIFGCTDPSAINYNPDAVIDDGSCIIDQIEDCKILNDPNYNPDPLVSLDNSKCQCPNGDYNQITKQCGPVIEICNDGIDNDGDGQVDEDCNECPAPPPATNYPTMPGYNNLCPIQCRLPLVLNPKTNKCELPDGDLCPTTRITYSDSSAGPKGTLDPATTRIENPIPSGYKIIGNLCGIPDCNNPIAKNYNPNPNPAATIDVCQYCPKNQKYNTTTKKCEICSDPLNCPVPPKGPINPIYIET
jgi:hypothetical protein